MAGFLDKIPKRLNLAIMLFMACLVGYMTRVNMSIMVIAMTSYNTENKTLPDYGPRYYWDQQDQANLLGAYFYGYLITCLPGGVLAEQFGGKPVIGYTTLLSAILTFLTPLAAVMGMWAMLADRFILGFLGGVTFPACHNLISKWAPPTEKGKFVASLMGGTFGTVVTWPICGFLIEHVGWKWTFYVNGMIVLFTAAVWFFIVENTPAQHKTISAEERDMIENSLGNTVSKKKSWPPFKKLLTSLPFWALLILHYGNLYGLFFLLTAAPKYMNEVLGFRLSSAGIVSSFPHLARIVSAFLFGVIGDAIRRKGLLTVTQIRKYFCISSHIIPGIFLAMLAYISRDPYVCVFIMTLSLGFNGAATLTNLANSQDLAPNYAGTIYGTINFVGSTSGIFSPLVVARFTRDRNTIDEWTHIFILGALVYIVPSIFYFFFGSGTVQKWNDMDQEEKKKEEET